VGPTLHPFRLIAAAKPTGASSSSTTRNLGVSISPSNAQLHAANLCAEYHGATRAVSASQVSVASTAS
jgi:hypothetical protein